MKKKVTIIVVSVLTVIVLGFCGFSYYLGSQVVAGSTQLVTNEGTSQIVDSFWEKRNITYEDFCKKYTVEKIEIVSTFEEHVIPADYIYCDQSNGDKNCKTVVMVHGLGGNRYANYPIAEMFLEMGYNVLTYDQRSSNENLAKYTTFGYFEKFDLIDCIDYVKAFAPGQRIGVWGTSFGGATAGLALGYKDTESKVDFLVLDCPVSGMDWMVEEKMRDMDIGISLDYMMWCGNIVNQIKLGFSYEDTEVEDAMDDVRIPVLIINSRADVITPYFMGEEIYKEIDGTNKELWTVHDSAHTEIWIDYNEEYRAKVARVAGEQ